MKTLTALGLCLTLVNTPVLAKTRPVAPDTAPLEQVIAVVNRAVKEYQDNPVLVSPGHVLNISSADFDFKTTTSRTVGASLNILIFKIGGSRKSEVINDVTYTYTKPSSGPTSQSVQPKLALKDALAKLIKSAAASVATSSTAAGLPLSKLVVTLQYGVTYDGNADAKQPWTLVTLDLNGDASRNSVQSVKLTFSQ